MTAETILETRDLRREFGALVAVDDVSMQIQDGALHSIIGPNGAGKTTLFNLVSGTLRPTRGSVLFKGEDITGLPMYKTIHRGIGRSFQITNIFPNLTVFENIRLACQSTGQRQLSSVPVAPASDPLYGTDRRGAGTGGPDRDGRASSPEPSRTGTSASWSWA